MLRQMIQVIPELANLRSISTDFERSIIIAVREVLPNARLSGCLFHYMQALRRYWYWKCRILDEFHNILEYAMSLAYLPAENMEAGFNVVMGLMNYHNVPNADRFNTYFRLENDNGDENENYEEDDTLVDELHRIGLNVFIAQDEIDRFKERKKKIQDILYTKIGVKVDLCLQGHGTTNTGNVARRCFENSELFAECLEINSVLVKNLAHILLCFKSKKELDLDKLEKLCIETYWLHYSSYEWSRMNPSTHKLLMHGCQICRQFPLPIAYFSEDSSEAWHKLNRSNLKSGSRQCSREYRLLDTFNKAVYLSDPKISMTHVADRLKFRKNLDAPEEVKEFFIRTPTSQDEDIMEID
uniref:MULE transposase domain-containing protein n=1 Tax=Trichogramma kaykai TaxID=54128 RepID=A0ABD2VTW7_9HYME